MPGAYNTLSTTSPLAVLLYRNFKRAEQSRLPSPFYVSLLIVLHNSRVVISTESYIHTSIVQVRLTLCLPLTFPASKSRQGCRRTLSGVIRLLFGRMFRRSEARLARIYGHYLSIWNTTPNRRIGFFMVLISISFRVTYARLVPRAKVSLFPWITFLIWNT